MDLDALVVKPQAVAREKLAEALHGLVTIVDGTGEIIPDAGITTLDGSTKVLVFLLALRAGVILGFRKSASGNAEEISVAMGSEPQRTRECLSRLKTKFLQRVDDGYEIPLPRVAIVCDEILKKRGASQ